jgi:hypothetical protein
MANSDQVRGIRTTKPVPAEVLQMPYRPQNKYETHDQHVEWKKKYVEEMRTVKEKQNQLIAEMPELSTSVKPIVVPKGMSIDQAKEKADLEARIEYLRNKIAEVKAEGDADPKAKGPKIQFGRLNSELDKTEVELEKLEKLIEKN